MPDILRIPQRFDCQGIDLVHPLDRMPPGYYPYLFNARVVEEGRLDARPGYTSYIVVAAPPHSLRRLNDVDRAYAALGYLYIAGCGAGLELGTVPSGLTQVDAGYSGNPLSLITFRPESSPVSWMYVYDANKSIKVRPDGTLRGIGVVPPYAPIVDYGIPAMATISDTTTDAGWTVGGVAATTGATDRASNGVTSFNPIIAAILYNAGSTGWACIYPAVNPGGDFSWAGERMRVILNNAGGNREVVAVREIHQPIVATTIAAIQYDSNLTGPCSLLLTGNPSGLQRNSLIQIGAEIVRVLAVVLSPDGTTYSVRCSTTVTHAAGATVQGLMSWYVYTALTHANGEQIFVPGIFTSVSAIGSPGVSSTSLLTAIDASTANNRPVSIANDYMHLSLFLAQNTSDVVTVTINIDVDAETTSLANAFTRNYYSWVLSPADLANFAGEEVSAGTWTELTLPLSQATRFGNDTTRTLANIAAIQVSVSMTNACSYGFDAWYVFGTYGPTIQPNSPAGLLYTCRYRDSTTNAASVPGPAARYELFPLREAVIVTPPVSTQPGVDSADIYRQGGAVTTFGYAGTTPNDGSSYTDALPDSVVAAQPTPDLTVIEPWPILDLPWSSVVNVIGTTVELVSGTSFNPALLGETVVLINGVAYQTFGRPQSASFLELILSAGNLTGATMVVASPTLAGQPLPVAFGPLEGPFAPVVFALGDPRNAGTLYYCNSANADGAASGNTIELCAPSEPLIGGEVWNGLAFAGSRDNLFLVRYSYLATVGVQTGGPVVYQFNRIPAPSGVWSRWAICRGPDGVYYLGRDGIYKATESGAVSITDEVLYPLFPHDGEPASPVNVGDNIILPVDMSLTANLRMSCCDFDIYFNYIDTGGNRVTLRYEIAKKRWFLHFYHNFVQAHYLVEAEANDPAAQQLLLLPADQNKVYLSGGNTDDGQVIETIVLTPSIDGGDERAQKLYVDVMTDLDNGGGSGSNLVQAAPTFNNADQDGPVLSLPTSTGRTQPLSNIASLADLALYRNVAMKYAWTGGPAGPRLYAWEASGYVQPYLSTFIVTQFINLSFPGWKHSRRMYPALISNAVVTFTIKTQDGRVFKNDIPSTNGQYRILPAMGQQTIKDLAFAFELDGHGTPFALFPESFTMEFKEWVEPSYIDLAIFKT